MGKLRDLDKIPLPTYDVQLTVFELGMLVAALTVGGFKVPKRIEKILDEVLK